MYNHAHIVPTLADQLDNPQPQPGPSRRERVVSDPCLPARLPNTSFIEREAEYAAPREILKQLRRTPSPGSDAYRSPSESSEPQSPKLDGSDSSHDPSKLPRLRTASLSSMWSSLSSAVNSPRNDKGKIPRPWKVEPYQVLAAVERRDITFLMEVRERDFELLLRKNGDVTPLLHAMRIGNQDVAIILLGAFSRYINHLQDEEMALPRTKTRLKALRANLKLAIDFGLQTSQSDLIASFLQTLIMSEGDKWVSAQAAGIEGILREGNVGKPVQNAENTVKKFATKQLGKAEAIATLDDYVYNATADLLMMAAWNCALDTIQGEPIPTWYFARDDRGYKAFIERLDRHKREIERTCTRRLKWQMRVLRAVLEGRSVSYKRKVQTLAEEFDEGPGV